MNRLAASTALKPVLPKLMAALDRDTYSSMNWINEDRETFLIDLSHLQTIIDSKLWYANYISKISTLITEINEDHNI